MENIFHDLPVIIYFDDILIAVETEEEHDKIFDSVLNRARKFGLKFNPKKMQYKQTSIQFLGYQIDQDGVKIKESYVEAVKSIPVPTTKKEVEQILGVVTFVRKFLPNISVETKCLRELTKKNNEFVWTADHTAEFNRIIEMISNAPVLKIYDPQVLVRSILMHHVMD